MSTNLTKREAAAELAKKTGLSERDSAKVITAFGEILREALKAGKSYHIADTCTLVPTVRAARQGRNPQTGAVIEIPEKTVVKARTSSKFAN